MHKSNQGLKCSKFWSLKHANSKYFDLKITQCILDFIYIYKRIADDRKVYWYILSLNRDISKCREINSRLYTYGYIGWKTFNESIVL